MGLTVLEAEVGNPANPEKGILHLGAFTLEALGSALDPLRRKLRQLSMVLV